MAKLNIELDISDELGERLYLILTDNKPPLHKSGPNFSASMRNPHVLSMSVWQRLFEKYGSVNLKLDNI